MTDPIEVEAEVTDAATRFVEKLILDGATNEDAIRALLVEVRTLLDTKETNVSTYLAALQAATQDTITLIGGILQNVVNSLYGNGDGLLHHINLAFNAALGATLYNSLVEEEE